MPVIGCMESLATNYNSKATVPFGAEQLVRRRPPTQQGPFARASTPLRDAPHPKSHHALAFNFSAVQTLGAFVANAAGQVLLHRLHGLVVARFHPVRKPIRAVPSVPIWLQGQECARTDAARGAHSLSRSPAPACSKRAAASHPRAWPSPYPRLIVDGRHGRSSCTGALIFEHWATHHDPSRCDYRK